MSRILPLAGLLLATLLSACQPDGSFDCAAFLAEQAPASAASMQAPAGDHPLLSTYTSFTLEADLSVLSENECRMIPPLVRAGKEMEEIFWLQTYGDKDSLMRTIEGVGAKPAGRWRLRGHRRLHRDVRPDGRSTPARPRPPQR